MFEIQGVADIDHVGEELARELDGTILRVKDEPLPSAGSASVHIQILKVLLRRQVRGDADAADTPAIPVGNEDMSLPVPLLF